jgi:caspase domain-containing protein/Sel1 repeat-containing protein
MVQRPYLARGLSVTLAALAVLAAAFVPPADAAVETGAIDKFLVVDCLLPGQVRRLGTQMTFLTARTAVKTSAGDCEIRGGEYVAFDRSNYTTALTVWLPLAQSGDKVAQNYVGEIYERGLGITPDHATAAQWYRKAAEQGYARAQVNLGFLYERGLGVPKDPRAALDWYRKSAGLSGAFVLDDGTTSRTRDAELETLKRELESTRKELERARQDLDQERKRRQGEFDALKKQQQAAASKGDSSEAQRLEGLLRARDEELRRRQEQVERLERASGDFRTKIATLERESAALKGQIDQLAVQRDKANAELAALRSQAGNDQQRIDALRKELSRSRDQAAESVDRAQVAKLEAELAQRQTELARRQGDIARLEEEAKQSREQLAKLEAAKKAAEAAAARKDAAVALAPPSIQLIDPSVVVTRSQMAVPVRAGVASRDLVGRVLAPAGLFSLTLNDQGLITDDLGMFRTQVSLSRGSTPVTIVAIDRQGKRATVEFTLITEGAPVAPQKTTKVQLGNELGKYYALVIGNSRYDKLPRLDTAVEDARSISELLKTRYGFNVTLLTDASRYQMMTAINRLSEKLTERDNLLIYYAGHGEIDRANLRAHWLPIDAEPNSDANWISSGVITDHLNRMSANHVLVIADSCYAGAMTRSSIAQLEPGASDEARVQLLKALVKSRSRTALTSGGVQPVIDGGGGKHSVFAKNFIEILARNEDILEARRLYLELSARVVNDALRFKYEQKPEYAPIQFAGHEHGDFLFVPVH